jgi:hypothetical protein
VLLCASTSSVGCPIGGVRLGVVGRVLVADLLHPVAPPAENG